jgi:hypothetical protein
MPTAGCWTDGDIHRFARQPNQRARASTLRSREDTVARLAGCVIWATAHTKEASDHTEI